MPHLSPLSWISLPFMFIMMMFILVSSFWFFNSCHTPNFKNTTSKNLSSTWSWL